MEAGSDNRSQNEGDKTTGNSRTSVSENEIEYIRVICIEVFETDTLYKSGNTSFFSTHEQQVEYHGNNRDRNCQGDKQADRHGHGLIVEQGSGNTAHEYQRDKDGAGRQDRGE